MDMSSRRPGESAREWAQRLHDERHGHLCTCPGNPGGGSARNRALLPEPFRALDTVPEGKRVERHGEEEG